MNRLRPIGIALAILVLAYGGCYKESIEEDPVVTYGRRLFNDPKFSSTGTVSCATCHPNGDMDNRKWLLPVAPESLATPTLFGVKDTPPYLWFADGGNDIRALTRIVIENIMGGTVDSIELDALEAYQLSLTVPANPWVNSDGSLTADQDRGRAVFHNQGKCAVCHSGPHLTNLQSIQIRPGQTPTDVPSLRWVFRTAPYFHDHALPTLEDVVKYYADSVTTVQMTNWGWNQLGILNIDLTEQEKSDLVEFLKTL